MAGQHFTDGASSSLAACTSLETTLEIKIKTLDSRIFTFHVEKNTPVLSFKEKIAGEIGVPVSQQRLIFRGKVLKDELLLLDYHVENGDTLHLVERQPTQPQSSSGTNSGQTNVNSGSQANDGGAGPPRTRIGQISHSVVLGTFNVGDQGDGIVPDVNRVFGAVLNSLGVGNLAMTNTGGGAQNAVPGSESGPAHGNAGSQSNAGSQTQSAQNQPFQFPVAGTSVPLPSFRAPLPDSLHTITEFINRMERVLSQNGHQPNQLPSGPIDQVGAELPSNARGVPAPEALSIVLRRTQQLVVGVANLLSNIAERLEREAGSTDPSVRSQIHAESVQLGLVMQHLGALALELGRTILTLRMGLSPAESGVNSGPAVYISSSGPNPIMAQPFPLQTSPLFSVTGSSPTVGTVGPIGIIGSAPRHINIHIHAGSTVGSQAGPVDGMQAESSVSGSGEAGPQTFPATNVVPTAVTAQPAGAISAVPAHPAGAILPIAVAVQPILGVSSTVPPDSASLSSVLSEVNMHLRNLVGNAPVGHQAASDFAAPNSTSLSGRRDANIDQPNNVPSDGSAEPTESNVAPRTLKDELDRQPNDSDVLEPHSVMHSQMEASSSCLGKEVCRESESCTMDAPLPTETRDHKPDSPANVPLGLGLGGLQPKRRSRQVKSQPKNDVGITADQVFHSLGSVDSAVSRTDGNNAVAGQLPQGIVQPVEGMASGRPISSGQLDLQGMMSQFVQSPALNGIFSGLASQSGVSAGDLRNMFHGFTQNPAAMNSVSQLAQQLSGEDLTPVLSGLGGGEGSGLDFSRMVQQMMPIVSRALGRHSSDDEMMHTLNLGEESPNITAIARAGNRSFDQISQVDIRLLVGQIMQRSSPQDVFRAVVQQAMRLYLNGEGHDELLNDLCNDEDLANEFMEMFHRDFGNRLQGS